MNIIDLAPAGAATVSGAVDLQAEVLVGVMPGAGWDGGAAATIQGSMDGTTFVNVANQGGTVQTVTLAANVINSIDPDLTLGMPYVRFRWGTGLGAARSLTVVKRPRP